ncbi:MAG: thioredoxin family protein [Candidatus Omnitrophica bacterium]|nr:thioredoxin family protein [Candidatus Omnitrophota bacterium]
MSKVFKALFVVIGIFCLTTISQAEVTVGQPAPVFTLQSTDGKSHSLVDFKGKFVVLEWFNHGCPFVQKHYGSGNMQNLQKEYIEKDVIWLSINSSAEGKQGHYSPEEANRINQEKGASPMAVLLDADGTVGKLYGAKTTPHMFVINPEGILIYQGAIDSIASVDQSEISQATNYVKQALDEAMAGKPVSVSTTKSYGCSVKY